MNTPLLFRTVAYVVGFLCAACIQAFSADPITLDQLHAERSALYENLRQGKVDEALARLQSLTPPTGVSAGFFGARELVAVSFHARNRVDFATSQTAAREAVKLLTSKRIVQFTGRGERAAAYRLLARLQQRVLADETGARASWVASLREEPEDEQARQALQRIDSRRDYEAGRTAAIAREELKPGYVPMPAPKQ